MPITALYRLSSKEVVKISPKGQPFDTRDPIYWGVVTDPVLPDGNQVRPENPDGTLGDFRVLGYSKILDVDGITIRNATQLEIDTFAPAQTNDEDQMDADSVKEWVSTHPRFRKIFKALLKQIIAENNTANAKVNEVVTQFQALKVSIMNASNLGSIKTDVSAMSEILANLNSTVTLAQAVTALSNDVTKDD